MSFEGIIGFDNEKKELLQLAGMLRNSKMYKDHGLRMPKGLLLEGAPGVGKTVMAKQMSGDGVAFVELRAADCCGDEIGRAIHMAFEEARSQAPAILLLDELDKTAGTSMEFFMQPNDEMKKILLQELDSLTEEDEVLVVATCNDAESLGEALTRPGRFDHRLTIDLPDQETRCRILKYYFGQIEFKHRFSMETIAKLTAGFSCADLKCLANETGIRVLDLGRKCIVTNDVLSIINRLNFNSPEKHSSESEEERYRIAVHEAGHTLIAMFETPEAVFGASILPQGNSLGHVRMTIDETGITTEDAMKRICVAIAGHVAEKEVLGKNYLGSSDDLEKAAKAMMNLIIPNAAFGYTGLLGMFPMHHKSRSVAEFLSETFEKQMEALDARAARIITEHRSLFDEIVRALVNSNVLTREQLLSMKEEAEKENGKAAA